MGPRAELVAGVVPPACLLGGQTPRATCNQFDVNVTSQQVELASASQPGQFPPGIFALLVGGPNGPSVV